MKRRYCPKKVCKPHEWYLLKVLEIKDEHYETYIGVV